MVDICVMCGAIIPEGSQICINCSKRIQEKTKHKKIECNNYEKIMDHYTVVEYLAQKYNIHNLDEEKFYERIQKSNI